MANNQFFKNKGPFPLKKIISEVKSDLFLKDNHIIEDIQNLDKASNNEITFLHTAKYKELSKNTKALACITSQNLSKYLEQQIRNNTTMLVEQSNFTKSLGKSQHFTKIQIEQKLPVGSIVNCKIQGVSNNIVQAILV